MSAPTHLPTAHEPTHPDPPHWCDRPDRRRWDHITVFNALSNLPYKQGPHAGFHPVEKVDDAMLRSCVGRVSDETKVFQAKAYNPAAA